MSEISLTASMRSNLLSLQQIAKLQDSTQLRLSTGLKVNSAIDNPSSYYTASSLNNRAEDLSALLDSMGQSVQTIKAATEGIEKAEDLLSQMKAIAEQVNTGVYVPEKSYFEKLVGDNGAVVSTADELRAAIDSGKEEICVYGKIDLGDISTSGGLELQENQKLVGVNYFGNFGTEGEEFSSISGSATVANKNLIDIKKTGCLVSDLNLSYESASGGTYAICASGGINVLVELQNLNFENNFASGTNTAAIGFFSKTTVNISGIININKNNKTKGYGVFNYGGILNIESGATLNTNTEAAGIFTLGSGISNIEQNANIFIKNSTGLFTESNSTINISGNLYLNSTSAIINNAWVGNSITKISNTAQIYMTGTSLFNNQKGGDSGPNTLEISSGAKIAIEKDGKAKWYEVKEDYQDVNDSGTTHTITADNFETTLNVGSTSSWQTPTEIWEQEKAEQAEKEAEEQANREVYQKQYNNALLQYDSLIKDSSYKGVNLLQADDLKVIFNENRSSTLEVSGVDLSSDKIGMMTADWSKAKDVQNSINQVIEAKNTLRSASTKLGNYYSIITERETFTDNLINVLEEGADKLTLADMNEESANMLSLQTQQQLAINSLSLASQASQAVLRLF